MRGMGVTVKRLWFQADQILKLEHVGTILNLISGYFWHVLERENLDW